MAADENAMLEEQAEEVSKTGGDKGDEEKDWQKEVKIWPIKVNFVNKRAKLALGMQGIGTAVPVLILPDIRLI